MGTAASGDHRHVVGAERVVADEVGLGRRQGEQGGELGFGEHAAARHGRTVPVEVWSVLDSEHPFSHRAGFRP